MIFRTNDVTQYPQGILASSQTLIGLEALTGADLLLSPLTAPDLKNVNEPLSVPAKLGIVKHTKAGLLVQVKIGRDFTSSIPKLDDILIRMLKWTCKPWLLIIADLKCDRDGQCLVDGQASNWTWQAVDGALCYWQLRGGMYTILSRDSLMVPWVNGWLGRLKELQENPVKLYKRPVSQFLVGTPSAMETLATFDNIGIEKARALLEFNGTLADSLIWLTDPVGDIPGIGKKTFDLARLRLGLRPDEILVKNIKAEEKKTE